MESRRIMLTVVLLNIAVVAIAVMVHYEFLFRMATATIRKQIPHRFRVVFGVGGALLAHAVEIWGFGLVFYLMNGSPGWGKLTGECTGSFLDCVYFSFTTFTTLGYGDIRPAGDLRYLAGIESLTGLVLVTWTASFLFMEMQADWNR